MRLNKLLKIFYYTFRMIILFLIILAILSTLIIKYIGDKQIEKNIEEANIELDIK
ncbi:MAG: hypothetical protein N4A38_03690 [Candidatus Gracilibacteria bacterium]|nr:hypothetical protein [Candidatus Gracilibacteria bacterium]